LFLTELISAYDDIFQAVEDWLLIAEPWIEPWINSCDICSRKSGTKGGFSPSFFLISIATHILLLPLNNLSQPSEMCDIPNLAEHYHIIRLCFISFTGNSLLQGKVVTQEFIHCLI